MGWDDNGVPTERRVENYYGVRCDPSLPYDPDFTPPETPGKDFVTTSRRNFVELCIELTTEDEKAFEATWRRLGLSVDWSMLYQTISDRARATAQRAFLRNLSPGRGLPGRGADPLGHHLRHGRLAGRARGPRGAERLPPHRRSTRPRAATRS